MDENDKKRSEAFEDHVTPNLPNIVGSTIVAVPCPSQICCRHCTVQKNSTLFYPLCERRRMPVTENLAPNLPNKSPSHIS